MKIRTLMMAVVVSLTCAFGVHAQGVVFSTGALGSVGWSLQAPGCKIIPPSAATSKNKLALVNGLPVRAITFAADSFGSITVDCSVTAIGNLMDPASVNAVGLTFAGASNPCAISLNFVNRDIGSGVGFAHTTFQTNTQSSATTANIPLAALLDVNNNVYEVQVLLNRPQGATCNPAMVNTFLEAVIP